MIVCCCGGRWDPASDPPAPLRWQLALYWRMWRGLHGADEGVRGEEVVRDTKSGQIVARLGVFHRWEEHP